MARGVRDAGRGQFMEARDMKVNRGSRSATLAARHDDRGVLYRCCLPESLHIGFMNKRSAALYLPYGEVRA